MKRVRRLPVRVLPFPAETVTSFYRRLCAANGISERDLWLQLRHDDPSLPLAVSPRAAPNVLSALGGLPARYLDTDGTDRPCAHDPAVWVRRCAGCRSGNGASSMCRRCARGETVELYQRVGPICVKHQRWHAGGADIDISGLEPQLAAQRRLNGTLRMRSVAYRSNAAACARDLLHGWHEPARDSDAQLSLEQQIEELPLLVALLLQLTSPTFAGILADRSLNSLTIATLLQGTASAVRVGGDASDALAALIGTSADGMPAGERIERIRSVRVAEPDEATVRLRHRLPTIRAAVLQQSDWVSGDPLRAINEPRRRVRRYLEALRREHAKRDRAGDSPAVRPSGTSLLEW
ncbi:hypothetical protein E4U02_07510 [Microbacterium paludicola]|jgi:hypothetical protein|uniref:TniQ family protein n=1 Tax=Microbacterium paludicola TaxID=300019 RepID=A0A4Y9FW14_9MICO|nr:hypothetical protein [Microbacterium paludicola]MBF0816252.1 hypothetical protein [Microbacterium paludicola]TFU33055.1 hypothetical protein E4U02_07510 [Microbacterium paludicola]